MCVCALCVWQSISMTMSVNVGIINTPPNQHPSPNQATLILIRHLTLILSVEMLENSHNASGAPEEPLVFMPNSL